MPHTQIEQRSHQPLGLDKPIPTSDSDIENTLDQITTGNAPLNIKELNAKNNDANNELVSEFVLQRPKNVFIIDGEKDINESIICTNNLEGGKTCLKLKYNSIELFRQMQKLEYFCSLPNDMNATYFECRKIT